MSFLDILKDIFYLPIFNVLMFLYWVVRDFGLSIVLLTIMVRLALVPMTFKQLHSQRKMMEIQPQLNALKAQYGDDKQGFAKAQMELMKENNVSMLGGCLPLLVQLPFLYGLFYALSSGITQSVNAINQQLYPFMKFASVTGPNGSHPLNTWLDWFAWLPGHPALNLAHADPTHILPILAALFTFIQVRMMQGVRKAQQQQATQGVGSKAGAQQNAQSSAMNVVSYITPLFTGFIAWNYPSGLSLYWVVGTGFAVCQQYYIYGWGGLFKGIPRLEQWAAEKNAQHDARREAKLIARGAISPPKVVDSTLAPIKGATKNGANNASKNGAKGKDWIDQAKVEKNQPPKQTDRPPTAARPFATLTKPKEPPATVSAKPESKASTGATNGSKTGANVGGTTARGGPPTTLPKQGTPPPNPNRRHAPPRNSSLPKPKGGKK